MTFLTIVLIAAILVASSSLFISLSSAVTPNVLATVCSQTQNQETCEKVLESDPRTGSADLPQLSLISLNLTMQQASSNFDNFNQYHDNSTDPVLKESYSDCVGLYQQMEDIIKKATELSKEKQYKNITELGQLTTLTYSCSKDLPPDSPTNGIAEDMLLISQTAVSVNQYVGSNSI